MEPEGQLPCSKDLASRRHPEPDESSPHPHTVFVPPVNVYVSQLVSSL
jgi:hypothetical protein